MALKLFSKGKQLNNSEKNTVVEQDDSAVLSPNNENNIEMPSEVLADASVAERVSNQPQLPMAILAHKLGLMDSEKKSARDFFLHGGNMCEEEKDFWDKLNEKADCLLKEIYVAEKKIIPEIAENIENTDKAENTDNVAKDANIEKPDTNENTEISSDENTFSSDMRLELHWSRDLLTAYGCIFPSIGKGNNLSFEQMKAEAAKLGITYGINDDLLKELIENGTALKVFTLAEGKAMRDGIDGQIIDMFDREKKISFEVDDNDTIDYKNLNWLQNVRNGETICKVIPPVPPEDGVNIRGVELKGRIGKSPKLPMGKNTAESEDHLALIATCDGQLLFSGACFKVQQMVQIEEDVDSSVGNLDVVGSVTVKCNVTEGFTVKATGDIIVRGSVEGAILIAGGNIQVFQGMNGSYKGKLEAAGNITSKYFENCFVTAGGTVKADSIINSTVVSSEKVMVVTGKGIILGSTIISFMGIEAKTIGNERNIPTTLTIGTDPRLYDEMQILKKELEEINHKSEENDKNVQYLQSLSNLDEKYQQLFSKLKLDQTVYYMNIAKKTSRVAEIEAALQNDSSQIVVNQLYPVANVTIGNSRLTINTEEKMRRIYKSEGEIILGSK